MKRGILFLLLTTFWGVFVEAGNNKEVPVSNLRVPAYPLVTIDPYISAWSHTDKLYEDEVRHWTGTSITVPTHAFPPLSTSIEVNHE